MNERERKLKEVMKYEFAVIEAALYLDSHPDCKNAQDYFCESRILFRNAVSEYEEKYGPLTYNGENIADGGRWRWIETPWPWELGE